MTKTLPAASSAGQALGPPTVATLGANTRSFEPKAHGLGSALPAWQAFVKLRAEVGPLSEEECLVDRPLNTAKALRDPCAGSGDKNSSDQD